MSWLRPNRDLPPSLVTALAVEERLMGLTATEEGFTLAASRFGLWIVEDETATRWDWHLISKARLANKVLAITMAEVVDRWEDGTAILRDRPEVALHPERLTKLTDTIHHRVRRSVACSRYLPWPGAGGWVVLRRVAGRDGLVVQVRLDPGADAEAPGFAAAVDGTVDELWPPEVPRASD